MIKLFFNIGGDGTTIIPSPGAYRLMAFSSKGVFMQQTQQTR
jgi:hypothetical protein